MAHARVRAYRVGVVVAVAVAGMLTGAGVGPAAAQVTAVKGSAFGYQLNVSLLDAPANMQGPAPIVNLPAGGSSSPLTGGAATLNVTSGPATFFSSGQVDVSTQGTTGSGSVTSTVKITNVNAGGSEVFTAGSLSSTCTASTTGVTGTTSVTGGSLQTDSGDDNNFNTIPNHPAASVPVPASPTPGQSFDGHIHVGDVTDSFTYIFNEQIKNPDGSLTVNAIHQKFLGSLAKGDLIVGQVTCGVSGSAGGATTTTAAGATTTTAAGATTTTTAGATTTTASAVSTTTAAPPPSTTPTTAAAPGAVGGGAYGFFASVGLFGGPAASRGPLPTVTLPEAGSATPLTASAPSGSAVFGPATLFTSDTLDVSTQGTPGGTVTSSATVSNVNKSGQEQLTAATVSSKCTASGTGESGSATVTGGKLVTSSGTNFDSDADDTVVQLPADPAPGTTFMGKIEQVGDSFKVVLNEHTITGGVFTVNAVHISLLGPTAVGDVIIAQSRCGTKAGTAAAASAGAAAGGGGRTASTGTEAARLVAFALLLVGLGGHGARFSAGVRAGRRSTRSMPWSARSLLR